jgi:anti-sigma factor ChrR (cupin superfamily)
MNMISCEKMQELLPLYVGGGLDDAVRREVAAHLAVCAECRKETALLYKLKLAQKALMTEIPESVRLGAFRLIRIEQEKIEQAETAIENSDNTRTLEEAPAEAEEKENLLESLFGALNVARSAVRLSYKLIRI